MAVADSLNHRKSGDRETGVVFVCGVELDVERGCELVECSARNEKRDRSDRTTGAYQDKGVCGNVGACDSVARGAFQDSSGDLGIPSRRRGGGSGGGGGSGVRRESWPGGGGRVPRGSGCGAPAPHGRDCGVPAAAPGWELPPTAASGGVAWGER